MFSIKFLRTKYKGKWGKYFVGFWIQTCYQNLCIVFPKHLELVHAKLSYLEIICMGTAWKVSKCGVFSGPYFPTFGLNTVRYEVSLRIQSECGKIQTRKSSVFDHFSGSGGVDFLITCRNYTLTILTREHCAFFKFNVRIYWNRSLADWRFQSFNSEINFLKTANPFQKTGVPFFSWKC